MENGKVQFIGWNRDLELSDAYFLYYLVSSSQKARDCSIQDLIQYKCVGVAHMHILSLFVG